MAFFQEVYMEDLKPDWMRLPLWRWQTACRFMADPTDDEYEFLSDLYLREASLLMHSRAAQEPGVELQMISNPALVNALQIFHHTTQHGGARWQIEALLLGGIEDSELNRIFPTRGGERTYQYYRKLFFDVDDYLDNQHALLANVFSVAMARHDSYSDHDLPWKMLGYALGWERFSEFLKYYAGGNTSQDVKRFLQEFQELRMVYYMYTQILDMHTAFQDKTLDMFQTSMKHYSIPTEEANEILTMGARASCQRLLNAVCDQWEGAQRNINTGSLEAVRSGVKKLELGAKDIKQLETIYEAEVIVT